MPVISTVDSFQGLGTTNWIEVRHGDAFRSASRLVLRDDNGTETGQGVTSGSPTGNEWKVEVFYEEVVVTASVTPGSPDRRTGSVGPDTVTVSDVRSVVEGQEVQNGAARGATSVSVPAQTGDDIGKFSFNYYPTTQADPEFGSNTLPGVIMWAKFSQALTAYNRVLYASITRPGPRS